MVIKSKEVSVELIENVLTSLRHELETSNISALKREEISRALKECTARFASIRSTEDLLLLKNLDEELKKLDYALAEETIRKAEVEIPKSGHNAAVFQALENIRKDLQSGAITPLKARHEVKSVRKL